MAFLFVLVPISPARLNSLRGIFFHLNPEHRVLRQALNQNRGRACALGAAATDLALAG